MGPVGGCIYRQALDYCERSLITSRLLQRRRPSRKRGPLSITTSWVEISAANVSFGLADGLRMDTSAITALAALAGALIGGLTSVIASWLSQRAQAKTEQLSHYQFRRQELYKEFIEQASRLYIHALQNDKPDVSGLMGLYAEISRMRVLSSARVIDSADQIVKKIIDAYLEPNKTFPELRQMADSGLIDPLRNFSEACRAEAESLHYGPPA